jgi:sugar lactone lactonase YvrE
MVWHSHLTKKDLHRRFEAPSYQGFRSPERRIAVARLLFHDMNVSHPGAPDGMKVDLEEHVYCTGAVGVWVFDKEGRHLGTIATPEKPSNCAWGDDDRRGLYITAITSVYKIRVNTPGIIFEGVCLKEI